MSPRVFTPGNALQATFVLAFLLCAVYLVVRTTGQLAARADAETFANPGPRASVEDVDDATLATFASSHKRSFPSMYDSYYAKVYRQLFDKERLKSINFELADLYERTKLEEYGRKAVFLDLGCGTGGHTVRLVRSKPEWTVYGLDQSRAMLDETQARVKKDLRRKVRLIQGDFEDPDTFPVGKFTHVMCYHFTIYQSKRPETVFANVHRWLQPGGYFCLHLVDAERFDPVPRAANPLVGLSLQKYMDTRRTHAKVYFTNFVYRSDFAYDPKTHVGKYTEVFVHPKERRVRKHTQTLRMHPHNATIDRVRKAGFKLKHVTKMFEIGDDYQFLCYFQKE